MTNFEKTLTILIRAGYTYIYIPTWEEDRAIRSIKNAISQGLKVERKLYQWSYTTGLNKDNDVTGETTVHLEKARAGLTPQSFIDELRQIADLKENAVVIVKDFHPFFKSQANPEITRFLRDILPQCRSGTFSKALLFISPTLTIPEELQKEITVLDFPPPTEAEFRSVIDNLLKVNRSIQCQLNEDQLIELSRTALGMSAQEGENALSRAIIANNGVLNMNAKALIFEEKKQVIRKTGILDYVISSITPEDIGGLNVLKRWLDKRNDSWGKTAEKYKLPAPKGVLITGVPGCGKSMTAKAMSTMWHLPLLQLDMGKIYSRYLGSSEESMRRAIQTAEAMAPCVLWIDEIEKGMSGSTSDNDSGASSRVFGSLLTWMQEKRSMVFIVATSNDISSIRPELLRKGRFDEIFFVDLPNRMERIQILTVQVKAHMCEAFSALELNESFYNMLAEATKGFVGAEIEALVVSALFDAFSEHRKLNIEDFFHAAKNTVPLSITQKEQIDSLREWASTRAVSASSPNEDAVSSHDKSYGRILHF
ncbi:MAG: AAA family ATPase [Eubacteriales bacterium]|nr:AAA family ATPase [Eubacteriales bacterium]